MSELRDIQASCLSDYLSLVPTSRDFPVTELPSIGSRQSTMGKCLSQSPQSISRNLAG